MSLLAVPSGMHKQKTSSPVTNRVGFDPIYSQYLEVLYVSFCFLFLLSLFLVHVTSLKSLSLVYILEVIRVSLLRENREIEYSNYTFSECMIR